MSMSSATAVWSMELCEEISAAAAIATITPLVQLTPDSYAVNVSGFQVDAEILA